MLIAWELYSVWVWCVSILRKVAPCGLSALADILDILTHVESLEHNTIRDVDSTW